MDITKSIGLFVIAVLLGVSGYLFGTQHQAPAAQPPYGALSTTEFPTNWIGIGGAHFYAQTGTLTQNASTTCAIQGPAATSTLQAAQIRFDVSSSSALSVDIGSANDRYSTTTQIGTTYVIAANAQAFIQASTSPNGTKTVIGPNQYVNFKIGGGATGSLPTGTCQAEFLSS